MPTDPFTTQIAELRALGGQRVWSLMISLFGDLAQAKGEAIDGPILSAIMATLDVKPEAVRVALHRLRNDGWITSTKSGRISCHALTDKGRAESAAASPRIYARPDAADKAWQLVITPSHQTPTADGFTTLTPRILVGPASVTPPKGALCFTDADVPDWLLAQAEPQHLRDDYAALQSTLAALKDGLPSTKPIPAMQVATLRCLIVHNWRRLVLKHPPLPAALISPESPSHQCHLLVTELLDRFPRPGLDEIDQRQAA